MKRKTYKTKPFAYTYKVYDKYDGVCIFQSTDVGEAYDVLHEHRHETVLVSVYTNFFHSYKHGMVQKSWENRVPRYELLDHFGNEVPREKYRDAYEKRFPRYRHNWWKKYEEVPRNAVTVCSTKKNPNKIKRGYYYAYSWDDYNWGNYHKDYVVGGYHRTFSTTPERRRNAADVDDYGEEYGQNIVRGRRRGHNLPDAYDDYPNSVNDTIKSWKHHSKRKKQWKAK